MTNIFYRPGKIGNVEIRNRLVMGPAGFGFCDETEGAVNDRMVEFFRQRARGGVGLIDVGAIQIDPDLYTNHDMIKLYDDSFIPGFQKLTEAVHAEGAKIMGQLLHQGRYCQSALYGVMIKTKLYIGFGVSGAVNHVTGIDAEKFIAVNRDPSAPIFNYCDYGIVGDMDEVCDAMIAALKNA